MNRIRVKSTRLLMGGVSFLLLCFFVQPYTEVSSLALSPFVDVALDSEESVQTQNNQTIQKKATVRYQILLLSCWNPVVQVSLQNSQCSKSEKIVKPQPIHLKRQVVPVGLLAPPTLAC